MWNGIISAYLGENPRAEEEQAEVGGGTRRGQREDKERLRAEWPIDLRGLSVKIISSIISQSSSGRAFRHTKWSRTSSKEGAFLKEGLRNAD